MQELRRQLLMRLCKGAFVFLALGIRVLCHHLLVGQAGLGAPPGGLEGSGYGVQGGKDCHVIICSMRQNCSSLLPYICELVLDNTSICDSDLVSVCSVMSSAGTANSLVCSSCHKVVHVRDGLASTERQARPCDSCQIVTDYAWGSMQTVVLLCAAMMEQIMCATAAGITKVSCWCAISA